MNKTLRNGVVLFAAFLGVFFFGGKLAHARTIYEQTNYLNGSYYGNWQITSATSSQYSLLDTITTMIKHGGSTCDLMGGDSGQFYAEVHFSDGSTANSDNTVSCGDYNNFYGDYKQAVFTFKNTPSDLSQKYITYIRVPYVDRPDLYAMFVAGIDPWPGAGQVDHSYFIITDTSAGISFQSPPYVSGMHTPDFRKWAVCFDIADTHTFTGFYFEVNYGTSSPITYTDSYKDFNGIIPLPLGSRSIACSLVPKSVNLTAGSWQALAVLFDENGDVVSNSQLLQFTVLTGDQVEYPNNRDLFETEISDTCPSTDFGFSFWSGGPSVDIGKGFCKTFRFLFVPSQSSIDTFATISDDLAVKAPFSYFYAAKTTMTNLPSSTTSTIPTLTISTPSSSPIHINSTMFSNSLLTQYVPSNVQTLLRTLITGVLSLAFLYMVVREGRHLMSNTPPK